MKIHSEALVNIVLVEPQIPPNTGNIARLAAATKSHLILVGELGFELTDKYLKRAGLDYWEHVSYEHFPDREAYFEKLAEEPGRMHLLSTKGKHAYTQSAPKPGDHYLFGKETAGLPNEWIERFPERCFTLPMFEPGVRSLNLGSAAAVVVYDALRQLTPF